MIHLLDSWESKYIRNLKDYDVLSWDDEEAKMRYPKHSWVYNKYMLAKATGVFTLDLEKEMPSFYPVIVKPMENLYGLSKNAYVAESPDEIEDHVGYIAQEYLNGLQGTTDLVIANGKVQGHFSFITSKSRYDEIKCFTSTPFFNNNVKNTVERILFDYTGIANVEYIDDKVLEIHLRPSLQFYDICGGFISQMPRFITDGTIPSPKFEQTYSRVFRTRRDGIVKDVKIPNYKPSCIRSIQMCYDNGKLLSETDPSFFRKRYMVINGTNLQDIESYASEIKVML